MTVITELLMILAVGLTNSSILINTLLNSRDLFNRITSIISLKEIKRIKSLFILNSSLQGLLDKTRSESIFNIVRI